MPPVKNKWGVTTVSPKKIGENLFKKLWIIFGGTKSIKGFGESKN